jgi:cytochrome c-type biogenesis protein
MIESENLTVLAAFLAGLLSFVSPCVLPLIPVYLGYLTGSTITDNNPPSRQLVFSHTLMFVSGFTFVFVILFGVPIGFLGNTLNEATQYLVWAGGLLLILFGLHTMGVITIPIFNVQKRMEYGHNQTPGYLRSLLIGMAFAAGWTPCIGPLLGAIMGLSASSAGKQGDVTLAMFYLFVYSMGLAIPFLITAWMLTAATNRLKMINPYLGTIERVSGVFILLIGVLLITDNFTYLNVLAQQYTPEWLGDIENSLLGI